ncbi:hypothetical protein [Patiriisocius marinus]|uniref:Sugar transporter n=1 Tax=Patiriisocius marinus TaxID=1397112 RepID=A0A5J4IWB6_9FLAO|nr:hypothetical protein [Patiriisocius marinus]GER59284.1 hypothetical protein ULMA_13920 [Patiriisocius marinus]
MNTTKNVPKSFLIVGILALLWNLMGMYQFYLGNYELESLRASVSPEEFSIMESLPQWYSILFGIAVLTGVVGAILLVLKKKVATLFFMISLLTVLIIEIYWLLATNIMEVSGNSVVIMPLLVIAVAIFLYFYSKGAAGKGWLN